MTEEVAPFGIRLTAVEPGFFRTELLDAQNARYGASVIDDYAVEGSAESMWSGYDGKQLGDPAKLGEALVTIANMAEPPKQFAAGSDALAAVRQALVGRLSELATHEVLSASTDGSF